MWNPGRGVWETETADLLSVLSEPFSETWPTSGMTRDGVAYELPTPELRTADSGSSSLLKTPTSQLAANGGSQHPDKRKDGGHGPTLADEVEHLLPTPQVADVTGGHRTRSGSRSAELLLPGVAESLALLPTPAVVMNDGESLDSWEARRDRIKATGINGNGMGTPLPIALLQLERGDHTPQPSPAGKASSEG
jgi:hypothetical protein